jgi:hypothetical protein
MDYSIGMRKIPLNALLCAVFCAVGVVCLSGCVEPVDLSAFAKDEEVAGIIEKGSRVNITDDSDRGLNNLRLIEGNQKISGLDPEKYYMVVELDENFDPMKDKNGAVNFQFVSANGQRSANLADIGLVTRREITGLTNNATYRVRVAKPLKGENDKDDDKFYNVPYTGLHPPAPSGIAENKAGVISLSGPPPLSETDNDNGESYIYTLTPPPPFPWTAKPIPYDIAQIPIFPAGLASLALRTGNNIITVVGRDTKTDYVFYREIPDLERFDFYVLRVEYTPIPPEPGAVITVTLSYSPDNSPILSGPVTPISYQQNAEAPITINITNNSPPFSNIIWYMDGVPIDGETGASFIIPLNTEAIQYRMVGEYTITVIASKDNKPYAATIKVTVLE